jgi:hypothetical protein
MTRIHGSKFNSTHESISVHTVSQYLYLVYTEINSVPGEADLSVTQADNSRYHGARAVSPTRHQECASHGDIITDGVLPCAIKQILPSSRNSVKIHTYYFLNQTKFQEHTRNDDSRPNKQNLTLWDFKFSRRRVWTSELSSDDGGSTYLWNVGRQLFYTAVHPRKQFWTSKFHIVYYNNVQV